jgi:hypothetical protein
MASQGVGFNKNPDPGVYEGPSGRFTPESKALRSPPSTSRMSNPVGLLFTLDEVAAHLCISRRSFQAHIRKRPRCRLIVDRK